MLLRRSLSLLTLLALLGSGPLVTAQEVRIGRAAGPSSPLEVIRTEDLKRRTLLLAAEGKRLEAARLAEQVAQRTPRLTSEWVRAIWLYHDAGAYPEMLRVARAYQAAFPGLANGRHELRAAEVLAGESRLDWNLYRSRIRETPPGPDAQPVAIDSAEGQVSLAYLLWREAVQPQRALAVLEKLVRTHPDQPEARLLLVDLYRLLGREDDAHRQRAEYVRLDPESPRAAVFGVWRLKALGQKEEAIRTLQAVRERYPSSTSLLKEIADTYDALERPDLVEATWGDALRQDLKSGGAGFFARLELATSYFTERRQWERLAGLLEALLADRPKDPFLTVTLAQTYAVSERPEKIPPLARNALPGFFEAELRALGVFAALATGDVKTARELLPQNPRPELIPVVAWLDPQKRPSADDYFQGQAARFMVAPQGLLPQPVAARRVFLPQEALRVLEDLAAERMPEIGPLQVQRALRLKDQGQLDRAAASMEQLSRDRPDWWPPLLFLFYYHLMGNRPEQAQHFQARLDRVKPADVPVYGLPQSTLQGRPFAGAREERFPQPERSLRAAQALMLEGKLEEARAALPPPDFRLERDVRRTLGAIYLAQEKVDEAQREWASAGLFPPFRPKPFPYAAPFDIPGFVPDPPAPKGDGTRLSHYPLAYVATYAASLFMRETENPVLGERLWELLLRQALAFDQEYVPALSGLGHALRIFPGQLSPPLSPAAQEARKKEARELLERVIEKDPANLAAYWALERYEEAARRNPESVLAWRRLLNLNRIAPDLQLEARRNVRRLVPDDVENRGSLVRLLASRDQADEALREARALAEVRLPAVTAEERKQYAYQDRSLRRPDPVALGRTLAGALLWRRGDWAGVRSEWAPVLAGGGREAEFGGVSLSSLAALASLATGDMAAAKRELAVAVRVDSADPLPRLLLAWLAKREGKAPEAEFQLAAAGSREVDPPSEYGLRLTYEPVLAAIAARYPDCFPASYLLAMGRTRQGGEGYAGQSAVAAGRRKLEELAAQFPNWSGPVEALQRGTWDSDEGRGEVLLRQRREQVVLGGAPRAVPVGAKADMPPGALLRAARHPGDYADALAIRAAGELLILAGRKCQVFEARTGALVNAFELPYHEAPAAVAGHTVVVPVRGGAAAFDALTGELRWTVDWAPTVREAPRVQGDLVVLAAEDGALLALDTGTGKALWQSGPPMVPTLNMAFEGERMFLVDRQGRTRALDVKTGKELWSAPFPGAAQGGALRVEKGQTLAFGGRLFLGAALPDEQTRNTAALDVQTGKRLWTQGHAGDGLPALWVRVGDRLAFVNTHFRQYELLDPASGKVIKSQPRDEKNPRTSTWVGAFGNRLIWLDPRGEWEAVEPETGRVAWKKLRPAPEHWTLALASEAWLFISGSRIRWHAR